MTEALTALEMAVLLAIGEQLPPEDREALREQMDGIAVLNRENTGGGFFTHFSIHDKPMRPIREDVKNCYVNAKIGEIDEGLGFILWLKNGYVDYLEGYMMALDSTLGMDLAGLQFTLITPPRNSP